MKVDIPPWSKCATEDTQMFDYCGHLLRDLEVADKERPVRGENEELR